MLPTREPPQGRRPTQTESEGLETNIPSKWTGKKSRGNNNHIRKNTLQKRVIRRDSEVHFIILKGRIHQENINIVNIYAPNIGAPKYYGKSWRTSRKILTATQL